MNIELVDVIFTMAVGLGATLVMDLWAVLLKLAFKMPPPNYGLVGRWLCHMPDGVFRHESIAAAPQKSAELTVGWLAHYATGVIYAVLLVLWVTPQWLWQPTLLPAMVLGLATVVMPFFVMQPSFGLGAAASKAPDPTQARLRALMNHAVFGLGLYLSALALGIVFKTNS